jgi:AAA domain-containing protein
MAKLYQPTIDPMGNPGSTRSGVTAERPEGIDIDARGWDLPAFAPDDPDGSKFMAEAVAEAEQAAILARAEEIILARKANRAADELELERSGAADSWQAVDLEGLFDAEQEEATVGAFHESETSNGGGVFYRGKVNEIHGPSESGKTMVLLHVAAQEIRNGNDVVMVDFEDSGQAVVNRLRWVFGLSRAEIVKQFHYFRPEIAFGEKGFQAISGIEGLTYVIIDAVTESMSAAGLDGRNENEVAAWYNDFPKRLARLGPAVVVVDHTGNSAADRAIGSQHKKSAIDGVSYTAEPVSPFVKGGWGHLRLKIAKDKPGGVRPMALPQKDGGQFWRGDFKIDGTADALNPKVGLWGVEPQAFGVTPGTPQAPVDVQLPPKALAPILTALSDDGEWMGTIDIGRATGATKDEKDRLRTYSNRLVVIGMADKKTFNGTVKYKITQKGIHSANAWISEARKEAQTMIQ